MSKNTGTDLIERTDKEGTTTTKVSNGVDTPSTKPLPRKVIRIEESVKVKYPELWANVWVVGPERNIGFPQMLSRAGCSRAESLEKADIVFFSGGGVDIDPALYGQKPHYTTHYLPSLMKEYLEVYQECLVTGTPMVGICLGAQFLHVMNGGELYQDIDNHNGDHPIWLVNEERDITVTPSIHHQSMYPNDHAVLLATADEALTRILPSGNDAEKSGLGSHFITEDWEACAYPETGCYCFQGHPEYRGYPEYTTWFLQELVANIIENPDYVVTDGKIRLRQDIRDQRPYELPDNVVKYLKENT